MGEALRIAAVDGFPLAAHWHPADAAQDQGAVLIINSATAVDKQYYFYYAEYMARAGFQVLRYDYRGIAGSRPDKLRGFDGTLLHWGELDFDAVVAHAQSRHPGHRLCLIGHSIGGAVPGFSARCGALDRLLTVGAQTSHYRDWHPAQRRKLYFMWHVLFPAVTRVVGYFPGKRLGLLEDVPKGVMQQWHLRRKNPDMQAQLRAQGVDTHYHRFSGRLLTLGLSDDAIGTEAAIRRLHAFYRNASEAELRVITPAEVGVESIDHFGFFSRRFSDTLWPLTRDWFSRD